MRLARLRPYAWLALLLALPAGLYCVLALVMTASLSVAPNATPDRSMLNARLWESAGITALLIVFGAVWVLLKSTPRRSDPRA